MTIAEERPSVRLRSLVDGFQVSQALYVVATLGVGELLRDGPRSAEALASATGSHARSLYRLLRALAAVGVFHEDDDEQFSLTDLGDCLRSDAPEPVGQWAAFIGRRYFWEAWGDLLHTVKTGEPAFPHLHDGENAWEWRARHPDESAIFDRAMLGTSRRVADAYVEGFNFGQFSLVADIGGGNGAFLAAVLARYTGVRGLLFDQPHVVSGAGPVLKEAGVTDRCEVVGGSFFDSVPAGATAYILKSVLHDWGDEDCVRILQKTREACRPDSRLLVLEWVVGQPNQDRRSKLSDLNMMVMLGGQERTPAAWDELFERGGFELSEVIPTASGMSVIVGVPR